MITNNDDLKAQDVLKRRMEKLGIREEDIEESFVRSGGHGGQNVNKTSTCVMLLHRPTGLQVKCQTTRNQGKNRVLARVWLVQKIEEQLQQKLAAQKAERELKRRQNRKPSQRAKARMRVQKAHRSLKKTQRHSIPNE